MNCSRYTKITIDCGTFNVWKGARDVDGTMLEQYDLLFNFIIR